MPTHKISVFDEDNNLDFVLNFSNPPFSSYKCGQKGYKYLADNGYILDTTNFYILEDVEHDPSKQMHYLALVKNSKNKEKFGGLDETQIGGSDTQTDPVSSSIPANDPQQSGPGTYKSPDGQLHCPVMTCGEYIEAPGQNPDWKASPGYNSTYCVHVSDMWCPGHNHKNCDDQTFDAGGGLHEYNKCLDDRNQINNPCYPCLSKYTSIGNSKYTSCDQACSANGSKRTGSCVNSSGSNGLCCACAPIPSGPGPGCMIPAICPDSNGTSNSTCPMYWGNTETRDGANDQYYCSPK